MARIMMGAPCLRRRQIQPDCQLLDVMMLSNLVCVHCSLDSQGACTTPGRLLESGLVLQHSNEPGLGRAERHNAGTFDASV